MSAMTDVQLAEIEARAAKATPGPWKSEYYHEVWDDDFAVEHNLENPEEGVSGYWLTGLDMLIDGDNTRLLQVKDADFIAAARSDIPDLLAEMARLRAELARQTERAEAAETVADDAEAVVHNLERELATEREARKAAEGREAGLRGILKKIEWSNADPDGWGACPICEAFYVNGPHMEGCTLAAALVTSNDAIHADRAEE